MATRHDASPRALTRAKGKAVRRVRGTGLTPRVRTAIEALIWGDATTLKGAAESAGLTDRALRAALHKPMVLAHYKAELAMLREGERAANLRALVGIRDDPKMEETAAGQKTRIEAVKTLEGHEPRQGHNVNVNVGVNVQQTVPGYVIDDSRFDPVEIASILARSGSSDSLLKRKCIENAAPRGPHMPSET